MYKKACASVMGLSLCPSARYHACFCASINLILFCVNQETTFSQSLCGWICDPCCCVDGAWIRLFFFTGNLIKKHSHENARCCSLLGRSVHTGCVCQQRVHAASKVCRCPCRSTARFRVQFRTVPRERGGAAGSRSTAETARPLFAALQTASVVGAALVWHTRRLLLAWDPVRRRRAMTQSAASPLNFRGTAASEPRSCNNLPVSLRRSPGRV